MFTTVDGKNVVGGVLSIGGALGHLVLLPHFDLRDINKGERWTDESISLSHRIVSQLLTIDRTLQSRAEGTPRPEWFANVDFPIEVNNLNENIGKIDDQISRLEQQKEQEIEKREELEKYTALLYENGKLLESCVERSLILLGYSVENYVDGDIEIDHIIIGPSGRRMIGESEGKDNTAIDISKFRQLESNINEDFSREETDVPAKGVLFGNGYRFIEPKKRPSSFTSKCLTNAKRLNTALVRTSDLYHVVLYILDNPTDKKFREKCREAIETTGGDIVEFPFLT